jgi:predicted AAA+ superfamily ATPase
MKAIIFLLCLFSVAFAWKLKADDTPALKEEGEKFVQNNLQAFQDAAKDRSDVKPFLRELLVYVQKAQKNNEKLTKGMNKIIGHMASIISDGVGRIASHRLHAFTTILDGNRDNKSYYVLDYSTQWIEARLSSIRDHDLLSSLVSIKDDLETARDSLDGNAQIFVQGVKELKKLNYMGNGGAEASKVKAIVSNLQKGAQDQTLLNKTNEAVMKIQLLL